jgi:hypothetical protein
MESGSVSCQLVLGERVVLRTKGGPADVEYALFDPGDIELHALGPGNIREVGYRTTVADARERLEVAGVTAALAEEAAGALRPIADHYARGPAVRRAMAQLGAAELFEGKVLDAATGRYEGGWLDLQALAEDLMSPRVAAAMQAAHLAALLFEMPDEVRVYLSTQDYSQTRRAGERSYRRVPLDHVVSLPRELRTLAAAPPPGRVAERDRGPRASELIALVRTRANVAESDRARTKLADLEELLKARLPPTTGPLADPELWAVEELLAKGKVDAAIDRLDLLEKLRGRGPATLYLRARAALLTGAENPGAVAERVSSLSTSMGSFWELELLAAEAWVKAGDERRARAFARDLVENPSAPDELRMQALEILETVGLRSSASHVAVVKPVTPVPAPRLSEPAATGGKTRSSRPPRRTTPPPDPRAEPEEPARRDSKIQPSRIVSVDHVGPPPARRPRTTGAPPRRPSTVPPPAASVDVVGVLSSPPPAKPEAASRAAIRTSPPPPPPPVPAARAELVPFARGASRPPFASDAPPPLIPPPAPLGRDLVVEAAEQLSLPPGLHGSPAPDESTVPKTVHEARVAFTYLSRELGRVYRQRHGIELRTDVASIEVIQRVLREKYGDGTSLSMDDAAELRRYGAFLSEVLARTLGAYWVDIGPSELGYWAMLVPPSTRVWPFGRVLRFVTMGHRERDLVSYYLELQNRTHA